MDGSVKGNFEDYGSQNAGEAANRQGAADRCLRPIGDVTLEEVERCAFFEAHNELPPEGSDVSVIREADSGRPAAALAATGEVIGLLSTEWNYLASCLTQGYAYEGEVAVSESGNPARLIVTLTPIDG